MIYVVNVEDKTFNISKEDILCELENSTYKGRYKIFNTYLEQGADRWRRGYKSKFQQSLVDNKLYYFAYVKFYLDNDNEYALVAGKSGSYTVNSSGCDLGFYLYPQKGSAKRWLCDNKKQWCQTEFLVISTNAEEKEQSNKEAVEIENYLVDTYGLLPS